jgi:PHP family Zn ribbon phosphoesterase
MIPPLIVRRARDLALGIIAITDHNSAENVSAVMEAAQGSDLTVLPGMEVQTKEEVHLVCLFDTAEQALDWQELIYAHLPPLKNNPDFFGAQFVVDATGDFIRYNERLLATSTSLSVEQVAAKVDGRGGLCIAAHVDRPSYSLLANLGFVPEGIRLAAVEITPRARAEELRRHHPSLRGYPFIYCGDVHRLDDMIDRTVLTLAEPTITEISMAFRGKGGRKVKVLTD